MSAREEAEELRQKAIETLLDEKHAIEEQLKLLGYGQEKAPTQKRRGRPPKGGASPQGVDGDANQRHVPGPPA
jgi:hypothetical protein